MYKPMILLSSLSRTQLLSGFREKVTTLALDTRFILIGKIYFKSRCFVLKSQFKDAAMEQLNCGVADLENPWQELHLIVQQ